MAKVPRISGSYAEFVAATSLSVAPMPTSLDFVQAAGVPLAALTAWGAVVDTARVHDGQRVLIHAGAGGVGHFAVQLAAYFGATVTATGSARNADFLRELGAHRVIDYTSERFEEVAAEQDVVIDLIGNVARRHRHPLARRAAPGRPDRQRADRVMADHGRRGRGTGHPCHRVLGRRPTRARSR